MNRNIFTKFLDKVNNNNFLQSKINNRWVWHSREDILKNATKCNQILREYNINKGDRIAFKGKNSLEWISWNLATHSIGATWIPMYNDQNIDYCNFIMNDSNAKILITDEDIKNNNYQTIKTKIEPSNDFNFVTNDTNELSTLIYTSGTTGNPKGVMLTHENILSNIDAIHYMYAKYGDDKKSFSILPWAHIYGMTCELYYNLFNNNKMAICNDKDTFIKDCRVIRPTNLYLVPRILDAIKNKIEFLNKPIIKEIIPYALKYLTGNNLDSIFVGGAKINNNTKLFFEQNNIILNEGYGCSETSPIISLNHTISPRNTSSIGKIIDNVDVQIINNEICVSGPNIMKGYWNNKKATEDAFIEYNYKKYYKTGDSGFKCENNFLFYNGRISDNYKLSNGKFVNIDELESKIKKKYNGNFIVFGKDDYNILVTDQHVNIHLINEGIESFLKIKQIIIINNMENFFTPKMSIKRKEVLKYIKEYKLI